MSLLSGIEPLYLFYPALAALLFAGAKKAGGAEGFMDRTYTKAMCGFFSICVILHHVSQNTAEYGLFEKADTHGLGPFFYSGYLFVSWFLFCSGFGLTKSFRTKENYLDGFGRRRVWPFFLTFAVIEIIFLIIRANTTGAVFPANDYSWYVYTLLVFYGFFYFAFRKLKGFRIACAAVLVILYCVFCRVFGFGEWWFNSAPVFILGMLTAAREDRIKKTLEKKYAVYVIAFALLFSLFFAASQSADAIFRFFGGSIPYAPIREARPLLQTAAASFFCAFIAALGMKIRFGNRVLAFLGGLTLETYLIQGLYIVIFRKYLFDGKTLSSLYVPDKFLYAAAVIAASVLSAFALNKLCIFSADFIARAEFSKVLWKDIKKAGAVIAVIAAVVTAAFGLINRSERARAEEKLDIYKAENVTAVSAEGTDIAAYVAGSGDKTVVMLRSGFDACPTMTLRPLADALAGNYRVVVLDFPGQGFSGEAKTERTADNIVLEIHSALQALGIKQPVVLIASDISGIYAMSYIEKYPGQVCAYIGVDAYVPKVSDYLAPDPYSSSEEYTWAMRRNAESMALKRKLLNVTGYSRQELSLLDYLFTGEMNRYLPEITEMYLRGEYNAAYVEEQSLLHLNCMSVYDAVLPEDMPALFFLESYYGDNPIGWNGDEEVMADSLYRGIITNESLQEIDDLDNFYAIYYNPKAIGRRIDEFLSSVHQ